MLGESHSIFTMKYDVNSRFFIVALHKIEGVSSHSYFAESFVNGCWIFKHFEHYLKC